MRGEEREVREQEHAAATTAADDDDEGEEAGTPIPISEDMRDMNSTAFGCEDNTNLNHSPLSTTSSLLNTLPSALAVTR